MHRSLSLLIAFFISVYAMADDYVLPRMGLSRPVVPLSYVQGDSVTPPPDTMSLKHEPYIREFSYVPAPLVISSYIIRTKKDKFRAARNSFMPDFSNHIDNYVQYSPFAMTMLLKAVGVEGRSQWGRFFVSSAFSYATMAALVNVGKYTLKERRPDGSSRNSFPSGHTATAFASATILHKEYGLTRSLWYSVAGYGMATMTGVMRVMNNRHWASDIVCGAGLGIFSVDLGYFIGDVIFKDKYILRMNKPDVSNFYTSPSFFNVSMGFGVLEQNIDIGDARVHCNKPVTAQAEMAYFLTPYIGAGVRLGISSPTIEYDNHYENMGLYSIAAGAYAQYPITPRVAVGGKLVVGRMLMSGFEFADELKVEQSAGFTCGIGTNIAYAYRNNIAWKLNVDYDLYRMNIDAQHNGESICDKQTKGQLMLSGSMSVMF